MNKAELVEKVADAADISKSAAARAVDGMLDAITESLKASEQVSLVGFGTFAVKERAAREGRNLKPAQQSNCCRTGAELKAGKALKDALK